MLQEEKKQTDLLTDLITKIDLTIE